MRVDQRLAQRHAVGQVLRRPRTPAVHELRPAAVAQVRAPQAVGQRGRIVEQARQTRPGAEGAVGPVDQQPGCLGQVLQKRPARVPRPAAWLFGPGANLGFQIARWRGRGRWPARTG